MKKQYLIGLLGLTVIFTPLANSLLSTNSKLFNSTYANNQIQKESIINEENSQVIVKDLDHDGKVSQGDQIDEIQFSANYDEFYPLYEDETKTTLSNEYGLNIYPKNSPNTIKPFYSISYNKINELNQNQNVDFLNFDFNSTNNSTWKIWDAKLPDSSQEFIITAESKKNNNQEKIIENNIGEVAILSYVNNANGQDNPTITSARVTKKTFFSTYINVKVDYEVDLGNNGTSRINNKYNLTEIIITNKLDHNNPVYSVDKSSAKGHLTFDLPLGVDYDLSMTAIFDDPASSSKKSDTADIIGGNIVDTERKPKFDYPTAVKIDTKNNILEIKGEISTNGSKINSLWLTNENHDVETWIYKYDDKGDTFYYDIWTPDYTENTTDSLKNYNLGVWYTLNVNTDYYSIGLWQVLEKDRTTGEDLSYLEDDSYYQGNTSGGDDSSDGGGSEGGGSSNNNNTMIIIVIIIGIVLFVGAISFIGYYLYKKNK